MAVNLAILVESAVRLVISVVIGCLNFLFSHCDRDVMFFHAAAAVLGTFLCLAVVALMILHAAVIVCLGCCVGLLHKSCDNIVHIVHALVAYLLAGCLRRNWLLMRTMWPWRFIIGLIWSTMPCDWCCDNSHWILCCNVGTKKRRKKGGRRESWWIGNIINTEGPPPAKLL